MHGTKMSDLKKAAKSFVDHFEPYEDAKIGVVPFNQLVNVGTDNASKPWVRILGEGYYGNSDCYMQSNETQQNQLPDGGTSHTTRDGITTYGNGSGAISTTVLPIKSATHPTIEVGPVASPPSGTMKATSRSTTEKNSQAS